MLKFYKTEKQLYKDYVKKFRTKNIPNEYNQIKLVDDLLNDNLDHYISISNRADGKSFNYVHFFLNFAIDYDIKFLLLSRNFTVRLSYQELIDTIAEKSKILEPEKLVYNQNQFYKTVIYNHKNIGYISDLNAATDLKYFSAQLSDVGIIIYDEFLAIESDYLSDEWEKLKTIYSTVNRNFNLPLLKYPKVFYLGNAVNLSSPILSALDIFRYLETQPINSKRIYDNIVVELHQNKSINKKRNLRAFNEKDDNLALADFKVNKYLIADDGINAKNYNKIIVKLINNYLIIRYDDNNIILGIKGYSNDYDYNLRMSDNTSTSKFLKPNYFKENFSKRHLNKSFYYDDGFSRDFILNDVQLSSLNIFRLISENENKFKTKHEKNLNAYNSSYMDKTKKAIFDILFKEK